MKQEKGTRKIHKNKNKTVKNSKKMNCNPAIKNKTISNNTCYTKDALLQLRDSYNRNHSDKIRSSNSKKIWNSFRNKLDHCSKEDCWLDEIKEPKLRQQLDNILFSPDRPNSWDKNPVSWLSNYDIAAVLKQYELAHPDFKLLGPSAIDYDTKPYEDDKCVWNDLCRLSLQNLYNRGKRKLGIVFNLDKHDEPGSHWVSMFVDLDENLLFYYDSALNAVPRQVSKLKREIIKQGKQMDPIIPFKYMQNEYAHQSTNTECVMYCIFFIITFLTKELESQQEEDSMVGGKKHVSTKEVVKIFTKPGINDKLMMSYRNKYFNKK